MLIVGELAQVRHPISRHARSRRAPRDAQSQRLPEKVREKRDDVEEDFSFQFSVFSRDLSNGFELFGEPAGGTTGPD
jgi:hypothetical protein